MELVRQQLLQDINAAASEEPQNNGLNRLRIKWRASKEDPNNGGYPYDTLLKIMSKVNQLNFLNQSLSLRYVLTLI